MKKTEKIRYEIDPHNRLAYKKIGKKSKLHRFRTVLDGKFEIDKKNRIIYHVKKSQVYEAPQQLRLRGRWSLDKDRNLVLSLNKWGNQIAGNKLTIKSEVMDAKANKLSFAVTTKDSEGKTHIYILRLGGRWRADKYNRLSFDVKKEKGVTERLTFKGEWEVNRRNKIIYTYEKALLKIKERTTRTVTFKGYWEIPKKHRIVYVLSKEIRSEFSFKVSAAKPAKRGLRYEIGVGATPKKKTITLFGRWKISKRLGLLFEMPYEEGKIRRVIFGGWGKLDKNHRLEIRVRNEIGEDLGIDVKLSRRILEGQGEAFIRALKSRKEVSIIAGAGVRW
jgi:hypothetical protein